MMYVSWDSLQSVVSIHLCRFHYKKKKTTIIPGKKETFKPQSWSLEECALSFFLGLNGRLQNSVQNVFNLETED